MHGRKAAVIGSGVAGLAVAIRLAAKGMQVTVYEKNDRPGGKISLVEGNGFRFDAGPSLFVQPENILALFHLCGENPEEHFNFVPLDIACRYFFEDGVTIDAYTDTHQFANELREKLGEDPVQVKKYLANAAKLYQSLGNAFINYPIHKLITWFRKPVWSGITKARPALLFQSLDNYNRRRFQSEDAVQLFNRFATYNGSDPYRAPAMLSMICHLELNQGSFFPKGGMIQITRALYELACRRGVKFSFGSCVERIVSEDGKVSGLEVGGGLISADVVVSNADLYKTVHDLLGDHKASERIKKQEPSTSAAVFYWGMNRPFEKLGVHNIFFSGDYRREFDTIFRKENIYEDPTVYVNISSKVEDGHAPTGKENWFVLVNAPAILDTNWGERMKKLRFNILQKLERMIGEPVEVHIEFESMLDPVGIAENTGANRGALYGISSNSFLSAFRRHPNFSSQLNGLYFCGGTVHPGGGIPLCLKSAEIASDLIEQDIRNAKV